MSVAGWRTRRSAQVIIPVEIQQWYNDNLDRLRALEAIVKSTLDHFCSGNAYLFSGRVKTVESVSEKIDTGRIPNWLAMDDAYAATIVIPTYSRERHVLEFLAEVFNLRRNVARGSRKKPPDQFRFDGTRAYCRLKPSDGREKLDELTFEVQVQSAFEYAWQTVTHDLVYKHATVSWRRLRVAAQMKALVEQLDAIGEHFDDLEGIVMSSDWPDVTAKNELVTFIDEMFAAGRLPVELQPAAKSRLSETVIGYFYSDGFRSDEIEGVTRAALTAISEYIDSTAPRDVPRSLSIAQLLFGVLHQYNVLSSNAKQRILLNDSMRLAFPALRTYHNTFDAS